MRRALNFFGRITFILATSICVAFTPVAFFLGIWAVDAGITPASVITVLLYVGAPIGAAIGLWAAHCWFQRDQKRVPYEAALSVVLWGFAAWLLPFHLFAGLPHIWNWLNRAF